MIRVIKDYEGSATLIQQLDATKKDAILVSPYVKLWDRAKDAISRAVKRDVQVVAYIRKPESENDKQRAQIIIEEFKALNVPVNEVPNLHAKIYSFDESVIVSSMNLYDFSQANSIELSVLINDINLIDEIKKFIEEHINAKCVKLTKKGFCTHCGEPIIFPAWGNPVCSKCYKAVKVQEEKTATTKAPRKKGTNGKKSTIMSAVAGIVEEVMNRMGSDEGYCIRCGTEIENNPNYPLCKKCYKEWNKYKNPNYTEKFCLSCGEPAETSMAKPYCLTCWRANK